MLKIYQYNCVNPRSRIELQYILDNSIDIDYKIFLESVEKEFIKEFEDNVGIPLSEEQCASFYKSITPEREEVYYFKHSGIEYIFY